MTTGPSDYPRLRGAVAGLVAAAVAIGVSELLAGLVAGAPSLVVAVGQAIIDLQPPGAKDLVVAAFGENDKLALEIFLVVLSLAVGAGLGILARRSFPAAALGFAAAALLAVIASLRDPRTDVTLAAIAAAVAGAAGIWTLSLLTGARAAGMDSTRGAARARGTMPDWSRRSFLRTSSVLAVGAVAAGAVGRSLLDAQRRSTALAQTELPTRLRSPRCPPARPWTWPD